MNISVLLPKQVWEVWEIMENKTLSGGQGEVHKLKRKSDGIIGCCKVIHEEHIQSKERRYRMQQEVNALKLLQGAGTPNIIQDNADDWDKNDVPLYAITEWIDGPTLTKYVNGKPKSLDIALSIVNALLTTLDKCHQAGIYHRDIKPDNIILSNQKFEEPILIDFGMAWSHPSIEGLQEFQTNAGQEIGNRFLRLPEYAPGSHLHNPCSDVTMALGILIYIITGQAPRILLDPQGKKPHEALFQKIPQDVIFDSRWQRLQRVFNVGFQHEVSLRYTSANELKIAIATLQPKDKDVDKVADALAKVNLIRESNIIQRLENFQEQALRAMNCFFQTFMTGIHEISFQGGGQGPTIIEQGFTVQTYLLISRKDCNEPQVYFANRICFEANSFKALYCVDNNWYDYYNGPLCDAESLIEEVEASTTPILEKILNIYSEKLKIIQKHPKLL